jgi:hypothetical protein
VALNQFTHGRVNDDRVEFLKSQREELGEKEFFLQYFSNRLTKITENLAENIATDGGRRVILK